MTLPGIVTNVTAFGAFVDVGVHQDGLVHVSQIADRFVKDPAEAVKVGQRVKVTVLEIDLPRKRIALSMRSGAQPGPAREARQAPPAARPAAERTSAPRPPAPRASGSAFGNALADAFNKGRREP